MNCALTLLSLLMSALPGGENPETGFLNKTIDYSGAPVKYVVFVPRTYSPDKAQPAILFLHGSGETGTDGWKQVAQGIGSAIQWNVDKWNYIVMFPQKPPTRGGWMEHEKLILDIVEKTKKEYKIDENRLYITGLSMGGFATWSLICKYPTMFAAAVPICGAGNPSDAAKIKDLPIWNFHGDKDPAVPIARSQEMIDALKAAGGNPKFTIYPGVGHNSWDKAYREEKLYDWFLEHVRK